MTSVITSNLATHLNTERSFDYYANFSINPDFVVRLNVSEFGRDNSDAVSLSVSWELINNSNQQSKLYLEKIRTPIQHSASDENGENIRDVVAAMNKALNELSLTIANKVMVESPQVKTIS